MKSLTEDGRRELIARLVSLIKSKLPKEEINLLEKFLNQFYLGVSSDELNERKLDDLYGSMISVWQFIKKN